MAEGNSYSTHITVVQDAESLEQADERIWEALNAAGDLPWTWSWTTIEDEGENV